MASEAALLGTPAVYTNTLPAGTLAMFARRGLLEQITDTDAALQRCLTWLADDQAKPRAVAARDRLLADKIDVTALIVQTLDDFARRGR
jgi:predicted glycosyltransferase